MEHIAQISRMFASLARVFISSSAGISKLFTVLEMDYHLGMEINKHIEDILTQKTLRNNFDFPLKK